jgi:hypothetical protein
MAVVDLLITPMFAELKVLQLLMKEQFIVMVSLGLVPMVKCLMLIREGYWTT